MTELEPAVLVVGDNRTTLDEVTGWVEAETSDFDVVFSDANSLRLRRDSRYQLVVLCLESLDDSVRVREQLVQALAQALPDEPQPAMVMLCHKDDVEAAYRMCDAGEIDDYVLFRPLYDPFRLQLVIRNGLRYRRLQQRSEGLHNDMKSVGSRIGELGRLSTDLGDGSKSVLAQAKQQLEKIGQVLGSDMDRMHEALAQQGAPEDLMRALQQELHNFRDGSLASGLAQAGTDLEDLVVEFVDDHRARHDDLCGDIEATCESTLRAAASVLLVEDEPLARKTTQRMLQNNGYEVLLAETGQRAVSMARSERPAIILLDLRLPDINGGEVLGHLKGDARTRGIPVIVLSGIADKNTVLKLIQSGVDGYQIKPAREDRLVAQIQEVLSEN